MYNKKVLDKRTLKYLNYFCMAFFALVSIGLAAEGNVVASIWGMIIVGNYLAMQQKDKLLFEQGHLIERQNSKLAEAAMICRKIGEQARELMKDLEDLEKKHNQQTKN